MTQISIAIDGPAAAGKSTIAKIVAEQLNYTYIDTGAMYRAVTLYFIQQAIDLADEIAISEALRHFEIELVPAEKGQLVLLNGQDVTEIIRSSEVTAQVSQVAALAQVRETLMDKQRDMGKQGGVVMDGRDIGSAVLPFAQLKIFMTASAEERASRRFKENGTRGIHTPLAQLKEEIIERDRLDSEREISPLVQADDAILIDTTALKIDEIVNRIVGLAKERLAG